MLQFRIIQEGKKINGGGNKWEEMRREPTQRTINGVVLSQS